MVLIWHLLQMFLFDKPYLTDSIPPIITEMVNHSKVTETLQQLVLRRPKGWHFHLLQENLVVPGICDILNIAGLQWH